MHGGVGVVHADGNIVSGRGSSRGGDIGSDALIGVLQKALSDEAVKAVVLRYGVQTDPSPPHFSFRLSFCNLRLAHLRLTFSASLPVHISIDSPGGSATASEAIGAYSCCLFPPAQPSAISD
jgi:hypothetical protein